ncbi:MAG: hypothetical protein M3P52_11840 [Actinomycetota bacterium]|nr:hypothetical protein [Actinomycetota bacterium]
MTPPLPVVDLDTFISTRQGLHRVAEHVVAKARYVDDGEIRLMAFAGGFATPLLGDKRRVRIDADDLVIDDRDGSRRTGLTTIGEAAAFVGVEPGFPSELYPPATPLLPDQPLNIDRAAAEVLAAWYGFTAEVLDLFAAEITDANPSPLILWPEHFDQAFFTEDEDESRRANYGASPGDEGHPEPYMYVGPWGTIAGNEFWNAAHFNGAVLPLSRLVAATDPAEVALRFLRTGRALLAAR